MSGAIKVLRILMVCFPAGGQLYCFCCRRFVPGVNENFSSFVTRFDKWSKLHPNIHDHDTLADHLNYLENNGCHSSIRWYCRYRENQTPHKRKNNGEKFILSS